VYTGDATFLVPTATKRTLASWDKCQKLMMLEQEKGILDVDCVTPSTITSHPPGYLTENDIIVGLQTDAPLKRACKPEGGFRVVKAALKSYGYNVDPQMEALFGPNGHVQTHNDLVFDSKFCLTSFERALLIRIAHFLTCLSNTHMQSTPRKSARLVVRTC